MIINKFMKLMQSIQNECKTFFTKIFCDLRTDV